MKLKLALALGLFLIPFSLQATPIESSDSPPYEAPPSVEPDPLPARDPVKEDVEFQQWQEREPKKGDIKIEDQQRKIEKKQKKKQ